MRNWSINAMVARAGYGHSSVTHRLGINMQVGMPLPSNAIAARRTNPPFRRSGCAGSAIGLAARPKCSVYMKK